jgi:hypothetical protein
MVMAARKRITRLVSAHPDPGSSGTWHDWFHSVLVLLKALASISVREIVFDPI